MRLLSMVGERVADLGALTPEDAATFRQALDVLIEFEWARYHFVIAERNFSEFESVMNSVAAFDPRDGSPRVEGRRLGIEANRAMQNYLCSVRFYLDATEARLTRRYGRSSGVFSEFKRATRAAYDTSFAYRFISKFRNYSQHVKMPIGKVLVARELAANRRAWSYDLTLNLDLDELLAEGRKLWGKVYNELMERGPTIDVGPIVGELHSEMVAINSTVEVAQRPSLAAAANAMARVGQAAIADGGMPVIGKLKRRSGNQVTYVMSQIPTDALRWLGCGWVVETLD